MCSKSRNKSEEVLRTNLQQGNDALKKKEYQKAVAFYKKALMHPSCLTKTIQFNLAYAQNRLSQGPIDDLMLRLGQANQSVGIRDQKIIVYTCNFGNYESVKEPIAVDPNVEYILFTDKPTLSSEIWSIQYIDTYGMPPDRASRLAKILAHKYLPPHDISIYIDSSLTLKTQDVANDILPYLKDKHIALYKHFSRNCTYDEVEECIALCKARKDPARAFLKKIRSEGFPRNYGLMENAFIIRKNSLATHRLNELWFDQYFHGESRDQFYLMYALWKLDAPFSIIDNAENFRSSPFVIFTSHRDNDKKLASTHHDITHCSNHFSFVSDRLEKSISRLDDIFASTESILKSRYEGKRHNHYNYAHKALSELENFGMTEAHHFRRKLSNAVTHGFEDVFVKAISHTQKGKIGYIPSSAMPTTAANNVHVMKMCSAILSEHQDIQIYAERAKVGARLSESGINNYFNVSDNLKLHLIDPDETVERTARKLVMTAISDGCDRIFTRSIEAAMIAASIDIPFILELHKEVAVNNWYQLDFIIHSPSFEGLIVITHALAKKFLGFHRKLDKKLFVFPDAADEPLLQGERFELVKSQNARLHIGYVGHLYPGKGAELAVKLAKYIPDMHFHMLGGMEEDVERWKADTVNIPNITFYGHCPPSRVPYFIDAVDVAIAPFLRQVSAHGGRHNIASVFSPLKIFEYMAQGKAIVCSDLQVIREVLTHERNALLCNPDNLWEWRLAFERLSKDKSLKLSLEEQAKSDFNAKYSWKKRAERILLILSPKINLSSGLERGSLGLKPITLRAGRQRPLIKWFFGGDKHGVWAYGINAKRISSHIDNCDHIFDGEESNLIPDVAIAFDVLIKDKEDFKNCGAQRKIMRVGGPNPLKVLCGGNEELLREKLSDLDAIICLSPQLRDYVSQFHEHVYFIPNGIDLDVFNPSKIRRDPNKKSIVVGMSASMKNEFQKQVKGYYYAKEACEKLGAELFVIGRGFNHIDHDRLIEEFYSKIDVFLHPVGPGKEASSNVTMEALALGIPVITTRYNGFHGIGLEYFSGAVVHRNTSALSAAIKKYAYINKGHYESGWNNSLFCKKFHDIVSISEKYRKVLIS